MTDIGGGIFSLVVTAIFLRYWKPKAIMPPDPGEPLPSPVDAPKPQDATHAAEAEAARAMLASGPTSQAPLTFGSVALAWTPFALMSVFLMLTGIVRVRENNKATFPVYVPGTTIQTNYLVEVPWLHEQTRRDERLMTEEKKKELQETGKEEKEK